MIGGGGSSSEGRQRRVSERRVAVRAETRRLWTHGRRVRPVPLSAESRPLSARPPAWQTSESGLSSLTRPAASAYSRCSISISSSHFASPRSRSSRCCRWMKTCRRSSNAPTCSSDSQGGRRSIARNWRPRKPRQCFRVASGCPKSSRFSRSAWRMRRGGWRGGCGGAGGGRLGLVGRGGQLQGGRLQAGGEAGGQRVWPDVGRRGRAVAHVRHMYMYACACACACVCCVCVAKAWRMCVWGGI